MTADHRWCRAPCGSSTAGDIYGSNVQLWCWYVVMWSGSIGSGAVGSYQEAIGLASGWFTLTCQPQRSVVQVVRVVRLVRPILGVTLAAPQCRLQVLQLLL